MNSDDLIRFEPTHYLTPLIHRPMGMLLSVSARKKIAIILHHGNVFRVEMDRIRRLKNHEEYEERMSIFEELNAH